MIGHKEHKEHIEKGVDSHLEFRMKASLVEPAQKHKLPMNRIKSLINAIRQTAYAIHVYHGHGHLEKVYENALAHRLKKQGVNVKQQMPLRVFDEDGTMIGEYFSDICVEEEILLELKCATNLGSEHTAQLLGYLKATGLTHGLLINFGSYRFQIRKLIL